MFKSFKSVFCAFVVTLSAPWVFADSQPVLDAVRGLVGSYTGHWETFKPDGNQVVLVSAWDDTITASNPQQADGRAFVTVKDDMSFTYPNKFPYSISFKEGFLANSDGSAGQHFYEYSPGNLLLEQPQGTNTWVDLPPVFAQREVDKPRVLEFREPLQKLFWALVA